MKLILRRTLIVAAVCAGLAVLNYYAPLQAPSVVFDLALVALLAGLISLLRPLRFLDISSRRVALLVVLGSLGVAAAALSWAGVAPRAGGGEVAHRRVHARGGV